MSDEEKKVMEYLEKIRQPISITIPIDCYRNAEIETHKINDNIIQYSALKLI